MTTPDFSVEVLSAIRGLVEERQVPEAVSVLVVGRVETGLGTMIVDEATARAVAPMVARKSHPGRSFGEALHIERDPAGDWLVDVEAIGASLLDAVVGRPMSAEEWGRGL